MLASADAVEIEGIYYNLTADTKVAVVTSNPQRYKGDVTIPSSVEYEGIKYNVTTIGDFAFYVCKDLHSVSIPNSVTAIGDHGFWGCSSLTSVMIPNSVTTIGTDAFINCSALKSIVVEDGNPVYDSRENCNALIKTSDNELMIGCVNTAIPNSVTAIGQQAFYNCSSLRSITIPNSVTKIGSYAFQDCAKLYSVILSNSITEIEDYAFYRCKTLRSISIPDGVTTIGANAFGGCSNLASLNIPNSVTSIGGGAFSGCVALTSIKIPDALTSIEGGVFSDCSRLDSIIIPNSVTSIGSGAFSFCKRLKTITIPNNVTSIGSAAFSNCTGLTSVTIPSGITSIAYNTFSGCTSLTSFTIPSSVTEIGEYAFLDCSSITSFTIGSNVRSIGQKALGGCNKLMDIYCYAKKVPDVQFNIIMDTNIENTTLHVPAASVSAYQAVDPWKNFKEIVALPAQEGETENDDYHPFVKEGKVWNCQVKGYESETVDGVYAFYFQTAQYSLRINGDTIIDGITYKKIYKENEIIDKILVRTDPAEAIQSMEKNVHLEKNVTTLYPEFMREEGKTVYGRWKDREYLLYDFSVAEGEKLSNKFPLGEVLINSISTITAHGQYFRCFHLGPNNGYEPLWVEGVGHPGGPFLSAHLMMNDGKSYTLLSCYEDGECIFTEKDFNNPPVVQMAYRPFIEDDKVWKVGAEGSGNLVQWVKYYYFDGDTIINGKTCKQMMCEQFVNPDYADYDYVMRYPQLSYVGAWYEEDKKVYFYNANNKRFTLWYDFSADANDTIQILGQSYVIGSKQTGGMKGFKGVYRDVMMVWDEEQNNYNTTWLEGIGSIEGPGYNVYLGEEYHGGAFLMSCVVGDEVIYFNDEYEDGATPDEMNARKQRIDFTHTVKIRPKAPMKRAEEQSLYGEYNERQLGINLNPLDEAYLVRITDESGKTFYEKTVNAGSIVGLNIDISAYAKGRYIVTVENSQESFTGVFDAQTQGIEENVRVEKANNASIYNLHGQRISTLQKGLNIVNGQKVYVK